MNAPHILPASTPSPTPPPLPKPAAPARPANGGRPGMKQGEEGGMKVLTYLRLHWLMIVFCGTLLGGAGAFAAWELLASKFESYALLQVSSVPATVASGGNREQARTDFVTYLKTTSALIKSEFVLTAALRDIKDLPTIKAQKDPIKFLDEELLVTWQDGSEVVRVTFKSHEPADAKRIVDAVQNAFMKEVVMKDVQEKQIFRGKVEEAMTEMRDILRKRVGEKAMAKADPPPGPAVPAAPPGGVVQAGGVPPRDIGFAPVPVPAAPPMIPPGPGALPPLAPGVPPVAPAVAGPVIQPDPAGWDRVYKHKPEIVINEMASLMQELKRLPVQINEGKRRLELLQAKLDAVKNAPVSQLTLDMIERDQDVVVQILKAKQAWREYEFRLNAAGDANAPGVVDLKKAYDAHEAKLATVRKEKAETFERARRVGEANKLAHEMETLIGTLQRQQEQYDTAKALLAKTEKQMLDLPLPERGQGPDGKEYLYNPETSVTDTTDGIYRRLVQQYYLVQMELNSPPRVKVIQPASNPTQKDAKKQIIGTVFASLLGFALMGLGVVAFETMARRVSSLGDVKAATPVPVVGVIPGLPGTAMSADPMRLAAANESLDKLRTYVAQAWLARGATTVAVTSPLSDEGKAFAAFGLASSLAQSGFKTLLVDFDLRDPQLHGLAGIANQNGVCELLRAEIEPTAAIQFLPNGLHLVPCGKWSEEARKAATGERLESLLAKLKGPYDCVVLHAHALLTAAESVEVARRCEVVLVCARYRETTTPLLKRAAERISAMEIPYSGVVYIGSTDKESLC
jgi:succinoglycan biosynthesis transport protein ExoP